MFTSSKEYLDLYFQEQERTKKNKSLALETEQADKYRNEIEEFYNIREAGCNKANKKKKQIKKLKESLLSEAIYMIYNKSLGGIQLEDNSSTVIKRTLVNNFIQEQGVETLLNEFRTKSYLLSEMSRIVNKYTNLIVENCEEEIDIDSELKSDFCEELDTDDVGEIVSVIRSRVSNAMDEFIQSNMNDKLEIKEILRATQEKIDSARNEQVKESFEQMGKKAVAQIRTKKTKNIIEAMVYNVSESTMKNEEMKKIYFKDNSLDMDSIVEKCELMYTFLETINTCKMTKVNESYINNILKGLKG